jgi:hypothetical protein
VAINPAVAPETASLFILLVSGSFLLHRLEKRAYVYIKESSSASIKFGYYTNKQ